MGYTRQDIRRALTLYAVTDRAWLRPGQTLAEACAAALDGGATFMQLREKQLDRAQILAEAGKLRALCAAHHVPFVVNDSIELALAAGADGVHLGQSDLPGRDVRALVGPDRILGISAGTVAQAVAAEKAGADYIGVGAVFPTGTKADAKPMPMDLLRDICAAVSIPAVAIGGIGQGNIGQLAGTGVAGVAVVSAIFAAADPEAAARRMRALAEEMLHG